MKCSLDVSNFLEEISSFSHSSVLLSFLALFIEKGLLISPYYSLELACSSVMSFPFSKSSQSFWPRTITLIFCMLSVGQKFRESIVRTTCFCFVMFGSSAEMMEDSG